MWSCKEKKVLYFEILHNMYLTSNHKTQNWNIIKCNGWSIGYVLQDHIYTTSIQNVIVYLPLCNHKGFQFDFKIQVSTHNL